VSKATSLAPRIWLTASSAPGSVSHESSRAQTISVPNLLSLTGPTLAVAARLGWDDPIVEALAHVGTHEAVEHTPHAHDRGHQLLQPLGCQQQRRRATHSLAGGLILRPRGGVDTAS